MIIICFSLALLQRRFIIGQAVVLQAMSRITRIELGPLEMGGYGCESMSNGRRGPTRCLGGGIREFNYLLFG